MKKLKSTTLQKFVDNLVESLKEYDDDNEVDIPFVISALYQSFDENPEKYDAFVIDLERYDEYLIDISRNKEDYMALFDVNIRLVKWWSNKLGDIDTPKYGYKIVFSYEDRDWGYCECTPDMEDYREDKHCCGHGCDATFSKFDLYKVLHIGSHSWKGDEHDYWEFEDAFYLSEKELADKKEKEKKKYEIERLQRLIKESEMKLKELMADE